MNGNLAYFADIERLYHKEKPVVESLQAASKLKHFHVYPTNFQRMSVRLAMQVSKTKRISYLYKMGKGVTFI